MCVFVNIVLPKKSQFAIPNPEPRIERKEDNNMYSVFVVIIRESNRKNISDKFGSKIVILAGKQLKKNQPGFEGIFLLAQIKGYILTKIVW